MGSAVTRIWIFPPLNGSSPAPKEEHPCRIDSSTEVFVVTHFRETLARLFGFYSERPDEGNLGTVRAAEKVSCTRTGRSLRNL